MTSKTAIAAHKWEREKHEHYVEQHWCSERLFVEEMFDRTMPVWDPFAGFGRIPESARAAGFDTIASDIVNRGYRYLDETKPFQEYTGPVRRQICGNPPFNVFRSVAEHALSIVEPGCKVALIFPTARLNAAKWLEQTPLKTIWFMTPRPSMPPGHVIAAGGKPKGGKNDFCWLVWRVGHSTGASATRWLHRDKPAA